MANRTMAAKSLKMKRHKRLFPRRLSADYIPVGNGPNRLVMSEYKERTRGLAFDDKFLNFLEVHARFHGKSPARREVELHIKRIQDTAPALLSVVLWKDPFEKTVMFFNSERTHFILYQEDYRRSVIRTSMKYMDRLRCIDSYKSGKVRWVECSSSGPPSNPARLAPPEP